MQLFRLMGMPDKMIAFDELPADLLEGLDMVDESRMPRHWKEFIGMREKHVRIPPDRDPLTGAVRTYEPLVQRAPYSYSIDREINSNRERWQEIESYVKRTAPKDFRLMDKLEDMAKPMARDAHAELSLEPEEVLIIPLGKSAPVAPTEATVEIAKTPVAAAVMPDQTLSCVICEKSFSSKQSLAMHKMRKHETAKV